MPVLGHTLHGDTNAGAARAEPAPGVAVRVAGAGKLCWAVWVAAAGAAYKFLME